VSVAYTKLQGLPMGREFRPFFAWYGDMDLVPHLWEAFMLGPIDVVVEFHPPLTITQCGSRKVLAAQAERMVSQGLSRALSGRGASPAPAPPTEEPVEESEPVLA
jgi:1-acyl-sn-glycerol-3-phosphate acyltransferase